MMRILSRVLLLVMLLVLLLTSTHAEPLTLSQAVALALANNPTLREAEARVASAQATVRLARAGQRPQVRLDTRESYVSEVPEISAIPGRPPLMLGNRDAWVTTLSAQQVLYSGGRLEAQVRQAAGTSEAVRAGADRVRQQVANQTARAFLLLVAAERQQAVAAQTLAAAQEHRLVAQARLEARAAAQYDVLRADVDVQGAQQGVMAAGTDIETARAALQQAIGITDRVLTPVEEDLPAATTPALDTALATALAQRPELRVAHWQVQVAQAAVDAARGERRPTFSLVGSYQAVTPESPTVLSQWTVAAVAGLPLHDGGSAAAKRQQAEAQQAQALAAQDTVRNAVVAEVRQAHARLSSALAQVGVARKQVALAEETHRVATVRYGAGVATAAEVADALSALTQARQGLVRARTQASIAMADLHLATGAPVSQAQTLTQEAGR